MNPTPFDLATQGVLMAIDRYKEQLAKLEFLDDEAARHAENTFRMCAEVQRRITAQHQRKKP